MESVVLVAIAFGKWTLSKSEMWFGIAEPSPDKSKWMIKFSHPFSGMMLAEFKLTTFRHVW
jgi:hypothetical protein